MHEIIEVFQGLEARFTEGDKKWGGDNSDAYYLFAPWIPRAPTR